MFIRSFFKLNNYIAFTHELMLQSHQWYGAPWDINVDIKNIYLNYNHRFVIFKLFNFDQNLHLKMHRKEKLKLKKYELVTCRSIADALHYCVGRLHVLICMKLCWSNFIVHFERKYDKLEVSHTSFKKEKYINRA